MTKILLLVGLVFLSQFNKAVAQDVYHQGYTNNHGTYVQPHYQTRPDGNPFNNYSTQGNTNPYTGTVGHVNPYGRQ